MKVAIKETLVCEMGSAVVTRGVKEQFKNHFQLIIIPFVIISGFIDSQPGYNSCFCDGVTLGRFDGLGRWELLGRRLIEKVVSQQVPAL